MPEIGQPNGGVAMKKTWTLLALALPLIVAPGVRADESAAEADLLRGKCTLCHTSMRLYTVDSTRLKEVVDRMTAKNPEWFKDTDSRHLMEGLTAMLGDPKIAAQRKAWEEAVARGKALYADRSIGTAGKACVDCHAEGSLGRVKDLYPKYNEQSNRYESIEERLSSMIVTKLGGAPPTAGDQRLSDLAFYLRSLRGPISSGGGESPRSGTR
jgi:cytochrome c553